MKIGILVHGRHLQSEGWEQMVWGQPPIKLGSLPMLVFVILNRGFENIEKIIFGTGASDKNGLKESEYTLQYLNKNLLRLQDFDQIRNHPRFHSRRDLFLFDKLISKIECEVTSQSTVEEIAVAAQIFLQVGITEVIQITNISHAPRCIRDSAIAREKGFIPLTQIWSVTYDMTTYAGTTAEDVAIVEPPHRGDDLVAKEIQPHKIISDIFKIKPISNRMVVFNEIKELVKNAVQN